MTARRSRASVRAGSLWYWVCGLVLGGNGLFGCGSSSPPTGAPVTGVVDASHAASDGGDAGVAVGGDAEASDADGAVIPNTAAGKALTWLMGLLNGPAAAITEAEVTPHFSPAFLQQVPASQVVDLLQSWAAGDGARAAPPD